jgi:hypothetical protein
MKNTIKRYIKPIAICSVLLTMMVASCKQDDYYQDGGKADPKFNGTVLQYLQSNPKFDTIAQIVKLAGLEDMFSNEDITFFCPTDEVIRRTIGRVGRRANFPGDPYINGLNQALFDQGKDTISTLADVPGSIWRKYMLRYVFKGKYVLKDYPQIDFSLKQLYQGGYYTSYNADLCNIGVVYNSVNNVKYTGYRQLCISFVRDASNPDNSLLYTAAVATSDVQPTNGVVHVLAIAGSFSTIGEVFVSPLGDMFGFGTDFWTDVVFNR